MFKANNKNTSSRTTLMNELNDLDNSITSRQPNELLRIILCGGLKFKDNANKCIFTAAIQFIKNSNHGTKNEVFH